MSVTAAHLRELTALGIVGEALIRVVEIIDEEVSLLSKDASTLSVDKSPVVRRGPLESTAFDKDERRKERDRIRKKAERAAAKAARDAAETSKDKVDMSKDASTDKALSASAVLSSYLLTEEPLKASKSSGMRARGTRLTPGMPLTDEHRAVIVAEGIHNPENLWAEFVDYWSDIPGQRGIKLNWTGTLRNRCRDVIKRGFNGNRTGNTRATGHDAILAAATRAAGKIVGDGAMAGAGGAAEFPERDGPDGHRAPGHAEPQGRPAANHHGRESGPGGVLEGEIIAPDKTVAGLSDSRQFN